VSPQPASAPRTPHRRIEFPVGGGITLVGDGYGDPADPPVVLLHGGGQTRHAWRGTAAALGAAGRWALALDQRGHGDSTWAPDGDYRLQAYAADLCAVADTLGARPAVVGASLGGLALLLAEESRPGGLASAVVLVDIAPHTQPAGVDRIISFMTSRPDGFATLEEAADAVAAYVHHRPRPKDLAGLKKNLRLGPDGRYRWHWDPRMMNGDRRINATRDPSRLERAAAGLQVPTLLVRGRMSDVVSEDDARAFLAIVRHARFADVSGAGHMVAGDRNDPFTRAVVEFLGGEG
jgi:pimeloyl-ACP methyl ester carboxylesterase